VYVCGASGGCGSTCSHLNLLTKGQLPKTAWNITGYVKLHEDHRSIGKHFVVKEGGYRHGVISIWNICDTTSGF
jgi:hypothetical protein